MANTLLCGFTEWIDQAFLKIAFPEDVCIVTVNTPFDGNVSSGSTVLKSGAKTRLVPSADISDKSSLEALLNTYEFEKVVFFSKGLDLYSDADFEEIQHLSILTTALQDFPACELIVLHGVNRQHIGKPVEDRIIRDAMKGIHDECLQHGMECLFLSCPWIYSMDAAALTTSLKSFLHPLGEEKIFSFPFSKEQEVRFISSDDLAELLYRIFDRFMTREVAISISLGIPLTAEEVGNTLTALQAGTEAVYDSLVSPERLTSVDSILRDRYGWFQQHDFLSDVKELIPLIPEAELTTGSKSFFEKLLEKTDRSYVHPVRMAIELGIGFIIMELLNRLTRIQVQFKLVDFRLMYIAVMGLMYNIPMGLSAAALASISLIIAYQNEGVGTLTLFYEPTNWFAFIAYFLMGAVCGYIRSKDRGELKFAAQESELLRGKYRFLRNLFLETQEEKHEYRQQILNSQDSFGKIFRITQELDVISPHLIFLHALSVIEEIMENKTVTIYSVGHNKDFARLEAQSRDMNAPRSLELSDWTDITETIRKDGLWTNKEVKNDRPMYAAGVIRNEEVVLLVMIWKAQFGQMSLYYSNLLKILCGLISTSLLRSLDYQMLTRKDRYYEGTILMRERPFMEELEIAQTMRQSRIANYSLQTLSVSGNAKEINEKLSGKFRETDMAALVDGKVYLLISQSTPQGVAILRDRFGKMGISVEDADFEETIEKIKKITETGEN